MDKTQIGQHKDKQRPCNYHAGVKARELKKVFNKDFKASRVGGHFDIMG